MPITEDIPATATPVDTLAALRHGTAAKWWQTTTLVEVVGADALTFLDGLCTQAVVRLQPGRGELGLFLDAKAKIIAPAMLWRALDVDGDPRVLLEVPSDLVAALSAHLKKYKLRAKATLTATELGIVTLAGSGVVDIRLPGAAVEIFATEHGDHEGGGALIGSREDISELVREILPEEGVLLADPDAWEAARIEAGRPGLHDFLPGRMPAEVGGMEHAVSLDGGCYLGQEPVARLHYRGHANRTLRRLETDSDVAPAAPASDEPDALDAPFELRRADESEGRALGRLATWARHPDGRTVAFATIRRELAQGDELTLAYDGPTFRVADALPEA